MCFLCPSPSTPSSHSALRRTFLLATASAVATPVLAQVDVGKTSAMAQLVPAGALEKSATQQYRQMLAEARAQGALAPPNYAQLQRLRSIAQRLVPHALPWNERARDWQWEVNLIGGKQINAFVMPGGKIAFYTGIIDQLQLTDDEIAMIMGHEMAHALREHARERLAKSQATSLGLSLGAQLLGLGDMGNMAANLGTQLLTLQYGRSDESEADLVGLEIAARAGYDPRAAITLWQKMAKATGDKGGLVFLSTHPSGPNRIKELEANLPKVEPLYRKSLR